MVPSVLILTGPTGSGKTALALTLAERLGAEIVAMDSMTLYRGMDVGTAKPTLAERQRVPHHLIDALEPWESASVAWWLEHARQCQQDIKRRGRRVLFVGGTPLYLKALLHGLFAGPPADADLRCRLEQQAQTLGLVALHQRLAEIDPTTAARLHPNDLRRVIRALEVWELTGRPISQWQQQWKTPPGQRTRNIAGQERESALPFALWLDRPRSELYDRINQRVRHMIYHGLVDEVRALQRLERPLSRQASQALGYKEMLAHLQGQATLQETLIRIQTRTRNFAKRQMTWFRHMPELQPASEELTLRLWAP